MPKPSSFLLNTKRLREMRRAKLLSQYELADKAEISRTTLVELEGASRGYRWVRGATIRKLAKALDCDPSVLTLKPEAAEQSA